jgi:hypothetical protein
MAFFTFSKAAINLSFFGSPIKDNKFPRYKE